MHLRPAGGRPLGPTRNPRTPPRPARQAIADRLAEAFAEKLHELVRREVWGYAAGEALSVEDMLKVKYQVRRAGRGGRGGWLGFALPPSLRVDAQSGCTKWLREVHM